MNSSSSSFPYQYLIGPILLVRFKLGKHLVYLFGDEHENKANPKDIYTIDRNRVKSGLKSSKITIERLIYEMYERAIKQNAHLNLLFEIVPSNDLFTSTAADSELKSRFDRLLLMFDIYKSSRIANITFNPVDFRIQYRYSGSGNPQSVALNYFSLFVLLFKDEKYDLIEQLFPIEEFEWDIKLLENTLIEGIFEEKKIPEKYKYEFEDVENIDGYVQAKYFNNLPHEGLKQAVRDLINNKVKSIAFDYLEFLKTKNEKEILTHKIADIHMWYMDIPAFCVLMEKITPRPGLTVGYYGAEHVTNLLPLITRLDPYFTVHVAGCEGLDLPMDIREELMEFI